MFGISNLVWSSSSSFTPASLNLTGWWQGSFSGAPWAAQNSLGSSGSNGTLTAGAIGPTVGTAQGAYTPADFSTNENLDNASDATVLYSTTGATIVCLFQGRSAVAPTGNIFDDVVLIRDGNSDIGISFTTAGVTGYMFDGGYESIQLACGTGAYHLVMMRFDGSTMGLTLDSGAETTSASGTLTVLTGTGVIGLGTNSNFFDGQIMELMTANIALTTANYASIKKYINNRYALSL